MASRATDGRCNGGGIIALAIGDHPDPFFAPIAAIVALSSPLGERGANAVRLLLGVFIGIGAGETTL